MVSMAGHGTSTLKKNQWLNRQDVTLPKGSSLLTEA
jgi:hypothetical protein